MSETKLNQVTCSECKRMRPEEAGWGKGNVRLWPDSKWRVGCSICHNRTCPWGSKQMAIDDWLQMNAKLEGESASPSQ